MPVFGTAGVRGVFNSTQTPEQVYQLAEASAFVFGKGRYGVGWDGRKSSMVLARVVAASVAGCGSDADRVRIGSHAGSRVWNARAQLPTRIRRDGLSQSSRVLRREDLQREGDGAVAGRGRANRARDGGRIYQELCDGGINRVARGDSVLHEGHEFEVLEGREPSAARGRLRHWPGRIGDASCLDGSWATR